MAEQTDQTEGQSALVEGTVPRRFVISRQGQEMILYRGLLHMAHEQGLKRIATTLIQAPTDENGRMAIVQAEIETDRGIFQALGDADPTSVGKMIIPHLLRMSETRAKARAMRDACNIGMVSVEELSDEAEASPRQSTPSHPENVRTLPITAAQKKCLTDVSRALAGGNDDKLLAVYEWGKSQAGVATAKTSEQLDSAEAALVLAVLEGEKARRDAAGTAS